MRLLSFSLTFIAGLFIFLPFETLAQSCGDAENPCEIEAGRYHIVLPEGGAGAATVIHLHGGGGTGKGLLQSGMAKQALEQGMAFIAPNGEHPENRWTRDWSVHAENMSFERDDREFLKAVLTDAVERHGVNGERVLLSGFSRGGSFTWDMACHEPDFAYAYAPMAGAFWEELPEACKTPVRLFHTHGWNDRTVPLEGRTFFDGKVRQGDVWASLKILRETNGCQNRQPSSVSFEGERYWRHWEDCDQGRIDLLLHPGGHGAPKGWSQAAIKWFLDQLD